MNEIDKIVDQLEEFIEAGRTSTFSNKVSYNKKELLIYVDNLKLLIPEKIRMAERIVDNEESILKKAGQKAKEMVDEAEQEAKKIIDESSLIERAYEKADEIIRQAEAEGNRILESANNDASVIRGGALKYASDMLAEIQKINSHSISSMEKAFYSVIDKMKEQEEDLNHNKKLIDRELGEIREPEEEFSEDFHVAVSEADFYDDDREEDDKE